MNNLNCQLPNHHEKKIITVCLDIDCQSKRLSCYQCIAQIHKNHQDKIIEVDQINDFIQQESIKQGKDPLTYGYGQKQIIQGLEKLSELMEGLQKILKEYLEQIKRKNLQEFLKQSSTNQQQGFEFWNQMIEGLLQYIQVENFLLIQRKEQESRLNDIEKQSIEIVKKSEQYIQEIIKSFSLLQPNYLENIKDFSFSNEFKHKVITIENKFIAQRKNHDLIYKTIDNNYWALIYTDCSFDPQYQSIEFDIEILQINWNICVGIGQAQNSKNVDYEISTSGELGHGQYMLFDNGLSIHSTNESINFKYSPQFTFATGNVIRISYTIDTNTVKFSNLTNKKEYSMKITELGQRLHPAVILSKKGEKVRICNGRVF